VSREVVLLVGVGALFLALAIGISTLVLASGGRSGVARGLAAIDQVYSPTVATRDDGLRDRALTPFATAVVALTRLLTPKGAAAWLQRWLDYAGNPAAWPPERVMEVQGLGLVVVSALGVLVGQAANGLGGALFGLIVGGVLGFFLPFGIVYDVGARRQQRIARDLPDALDLLTLSVEAGLGFDAALAQVAGTMPGPLAREIARALHEMQMGMRRADALRALATRTRVSELRTVSTAVVQAGELGIPIASVLREQANEMRLKRRQRAEEQAQKVPVKVTVPLILCLFPALFIVVIGPAVINIMHTFLNK
jgi:tight adherence protein C